MTQKHYIYGDGMNAKNEEKKRKAPYKSEDYYFRPEGDSE